MESAQSLKRRMKSVQNIEQITKAMELVAATKMRRAQEIALASRPYSYAALELLGVLSGLKDAPLPELLRARPVARRLLVIMTSDKGLAGAFNGAVIRKFESFVASEGIDLYGGNFSFVAIGQKAKTYLERRKLPVAAAFTRVGDFTRPAEAAPIAEFLIGGFLRRDFDSATVFFTTFVTTLRQEPVAREFLPVSYEAVKESIEETIPRAGRYSAYAQSASFFAFGARQPEYLIEPSPREVLAKLAAELLKARLYHAILEANASEHSARRVAMKNASENAADISRALTMEYNKSRQAAITREIIEVTSGAESLSS